MNINYVEKPPDLQQGQPEKKTLLDRILSFSFGNLRSHYQSLRDRAAEDALKNIDYEQMKKEALGMLSTLRSHVHYERTRILDTVKTFIKEEYKCEQCNGHLVSRNGKYSSFWGCSRYPRCKFTREKSVHGLLRK